MKPHRGSSSGMSNQSKYNHQTYYVVERSLGRNYGDHVDRITQNDDEERLDQLHTDVRCRVCHSQACVVVDIKSYSHSLALALRRSVDGFFLANLVILTAILFPAVFVSGSLMVAVLRFPSVIFLLTPDDELSLSIFPGSTSVSSLFENPAAPTVCCTSSR